MFTSTHPCSGRTRPFGNPFPTYLPEWERVGDATFWRRMHCDSLGWPKHGHLVWASPGWWERKFKENGLVRDKEIEGVIQDVLSGFFKNDARP